MTTQSDSIAWELSQLAQEVIKDTTVRGQLQYLLLLLMIQDVKPLAPCLLRNYLELSLSHWNDEESISFVYDHILSYWSENLPTNCPPLNISPVEWPYVAASLNGLGIKHGLYSIFFEKVREFKFRRFIVQEIINQLSEDTYPWIGPWVDQIRDRI